MGFWGIEVKPGKPHPYHSDNVPGILHITQATLGFGSSSESERTILQCSIGHNSPIYLCSLLPNKNESCFLDLQFGDEDDDDVVAFSVIGPQSIHLSGYFVAADDGHQLRDEYDSYGEDVADETESDDSSEFDTEDEYADLYGEDDEEDDVDSDEDEFAFLPKRSKKSGVVIEEIEDDEKLTNGKSEKKKKQSKDSGDSERQIVLGKATSEPVLESEDEDGFPVAEAQGGDKKRKIKSADDADQLERKKKKKKKNQKEKEKSIVNDKSQTPPVENVVANEKPSSDMVVDATPTTTPSETTSEKKKNKKKNKKNKKTQETPVVTTEPQTVSPSNDNNKTPTAKTEAKKAATAKPSVRTFPNGLVIEDVAMGKPDGKRATRGKQIAVRYTGKLKKNGKQFDSNVGRAPFKFRLGVGSVIKGWDVGVEGMRVGDKRKLIIPPDMGYGAKGAGGAIPGNAWLEFDVELIDVC